MRTIKIVSDGTDHGTQILDAETNEPLAHVVKVEWQIELHRAATATVTFRQVPVELIAPAEEKPEKPNTLTVEVKSCARCGNNHLVPFNKFEEPAEIGERVFQYWGMCPNTMDPILLQVKENTEVVP